MQGMTIAILDELNTITVYDYEDRFQNFKLVKGVKRFKIGDTVTNLSVSIFKPEILLCYTSHSKMIYLLDTNN